LIEKARAGDRRAFDRLLEEARPRAVAVAMKVLRNPNDAEDAVQEAMLKVWRYLPRFEGRASFFTWIHRIVMNSSLDLRRKEKVRATEREENDDGERVDISEPAHEETPERIMQAREASAQVQTALADLSPAHREAIVLRELEEHSYEEIAEKAGCPIGTVMSRLHHARKRLADVVGAWEPGLALGRDASGATELALSAA
jgi:RNA polymerase sigma-70 factor (ECF subfamily)